ncbi:MAG TPA: ROK family protein [Verrucomicrobiales bacterium]|nr:ROK family protein [Verrucomicrobiales bacterium]
MTYILGIDLGGTRIKVEAIDPASGASLGTWRRETRDGELVGDVPAFACEIGDAIHTAALQLGGQPDAVGLSSPGLADARSERIAFMPGRLRGLEGFDWPGYLDMPGRVRVLNDGHAALLGEAWLGAARGLQDVVLLTLGTGVGGAVLCQGKLLRGHIGRAGHFGHMTVDAAGPPDICGTPGSLEDAIGNWNVETRSGSRFASTDALTRACREGDPAAAAVWNQSLDALAAAIASLINILDPEAVLIGGGIAVSGNLLFDGLAHRLESIEWRPLGRGVRVAPCQLGDAAGSYGAACFAANPEAY